MRALHSLGATCTPVYCNITDVVAIGPMVHLFFGSRIEESPAKPPRPATPHTPAEPGVEASPRENVLRFYIAANRDLAYMVAQRLANEHNMRLEPIEQQPQLNPVV
jgi:hypothetical protein